ncbi:MAG TPA: hypothetical protein VHX44_02175 [Planctomycetota bacterium]|nr:hypothetical protein [Planctomycetota bacterium]
MNVPAPLLPGTRHPYAPMALSTLARFVHVPVVEVARWIAEGLPQTANGLIDPFVCSNWLCAGRLDRCPTLARRWRTYLLFFAPFIAGQDRVRRLTWTRSQRLYLPQRPAHLTWWLARAATTGAQEVEHEDTPALPGTTTSAAGHWWRIDGTPGEAEPQLSAATQVRITPRQVLASGSLDHQELVQVMEDVVGAFRYEYRHHQPSEYHAAFTNNVIDQVRQSGSCLDAAMAMGAELTRRSRPWRVVAGVVADSRIANPHFWIEVDSTVGWAPLDPTLPAIVRMVGGDWRTAVRAWTGACDARRLTLGVVQEGVPDIPGGSTSGSLMGEAVADGVSAWPCLDWVCGDCEAEFSEVP